jgi:oxygen-independent coproporphyrinogen-3 oxidase
MEPNTLFHQKPPKLPDEDDIIDWQIANQARLAEAGYMQYEVSAYASKNKQCQHNMNYWQFGDYIGIGAGAHGKISDASNQSITRTSKQKQPQAYLSSAGTPNVILTQELIAESELGFEFMLNALRLTEGVSTSLFYQHTGLPISKIAQQLKQAEDQGLITHDIHRIRPTEHGHRYLNTLIELFLPE